MLILKIDLPGGGEFSGWVEAQRTQRAMFAATQGVPRTLLFGDSPSGLNTNGQGARLWRASRKTQPTE